jgi:hypothetical protein
VPPAPHALKSAVACAHAPGQASVHSPPPLSPFGLRIGRSSNFPTYSTLRGSWVEGEGAPEGPGAFTETYTRNRHCWRDHDGDNELCTRPSASVGRVGRANARMTGERRAPPPCTPAACARTAAPACSPRPWAAAAALRWRPPAPVVRSSSRPASSSKTSGAPSTVECVRERGRASRLRVVGSTARRVLARQDQPWRCLTARHCRHCRHSYFLLSAVRGRRIRKTLRRYYAGGDARSETPGL